MHHKFDDALISFRRETSTHLRYKSIECSSNFSIEIPIVLKLRIIAFNESFGSLTKRDIEYLQIKTHDEYMFLRHSATSLYAVIEKDSSAIANE